MEVKVEGVVVKRVIKITNSSIGLLTLIEDVTPKKIWLSMVLSLLIWLKLRIISSNFTQLYSENENWNPDLDGLPFHSISDEEEEREVFGGGERHEWG